MKHHYEGLRGKDGAHRMLDYWGLRIKGKSFSDGQKREASGEMRVSIDDELALVAYVEETPGFEQVRPILVHVYAEHQPLESYGYVGWRLVRRIGCWDTVVCWDGVERRLPLMETVRVQETPLQAALRHGQAELYVMRSMHGGCDMGWLAGKCLKGFTSALADRLESDPFFVPRRVEIAMDAETAASLGSAAAERKYPVRWTPSRRRSR